jgi:hypothetical protein
MKVTYVLGTKLFRKLDNWKKIQIGKAKEKEGY